MKPEKKREVIELVRRSPVAKKEMLAELGLSSSTFYRWQRRYREQGEVGLVDRRPQPETIWNRLRPAEEQTILKTALREPDYSSREIAYWLSDNAGFAISESSTYCRATPIAGALTVAADARTNRNGAAALSRGDTLSGLTRWTPRRPTFIYR